MMHKHSQKDTYIYHKKLSLALASTDIGMSLFKLINYGQVMLIYDIYVIVLELKLVSR